MKDYIWQGRSDGPGFEHARWHSTVVSAQRGDGEGIGAVCEGAVVLVGFASDEGVRRNHGRPGARNAPCALRDALASVAIHDDRVRVDAGTIVSGEDLESGQQLLAHTVQSVLSDGAQCVVTLGGGHETSWGSHQGVRGAFPSSRIGIINLDAHFDLRTAPYPTSGTPFRQIAQAWPEAFHYHVLGISRPNNTAALFTVAKQLGVEVIEDFQLAEYSVQQAQELIDRITAGYDVIHLSIDLDVLPAATAPGVSAPAGLGVDLRVIRALCVAAARTGKVKLVDVVELNPEFDADQRTAKVAARLIDDIITHIPAATVD
ncbi:formimidoylglutamase [Corynebacterium felinum]|uniref:Formimidoylglutamase n=1 Tax=Corynebacterium felinum TaxID=131318 RepID=A0ABU2BBY7_9CORY|nr:formimidoylglutamase [Corynebacterium felinum]MDF5820089.1 formimidoylglutamase [Corynebacterium felinum]MDR7355881.1 formiminoglutamase [Corynebacterium felinum]WJY95224.1 Formimidoylglutamase [Corynebacterium felinum]